MAQSGSATGVTRLPLSGAKRTSRTPFLTSANGPERKLKRNRRDCSIPRVVAHDIGKVNFSAGALEHSWQHMQ